MMTNNMKPKLFTSNHQLVTFFPVIVITSGTAVAYSTGKNQLNPMAPRKPDAKWATGLFRVSNSD